MQPVITARKKPRRKRYILTPDILRRIQDGCSLRGDCLIWMGRVARSPRGYITPVLGINGDSLTIRRLLKSKDLEGLPTNVYPVSTCGEARCVAPNHLILKTSREIAAPPQRRKRAYLPPGLSLNCCPSGHEMTDENTYWAYANSPSRRRRMCRICHNGNLSSKAHWHLLETLGVSASDA